MTPDRFCALVPATQAELRAAMVYALAAAHRLM